MKEYQKSMTREELSRLAASAQLSLSPAEEAALAADLGAILAMVADLAEFDVAAAAPAALPTATLRADRVGESLPRAAVLANAADCTDVYIAVPRVVE